jgi:N-acetylglucosaminyl-diphospho-decaprenol L-rhamnosyltransferase
VSRAVVPLAVAVISYNTRAELELCLECVMAAEPAEVVVVDNGSTDGSPQLVRDRFPSVSLIVEARNRGYGAAANRALAATSAEGVLLLNSDAFVEPDAPAILARQLQEHERAAIIGPRLENLDGTLQRSAYPFPSAADTFLGESGLHLAVRRVPWLRERFLRTWSHDRACTVPWVLGAALAIRRSAFDRVGGFDEGFFMYGEEVDLCRRLAGAGFHVRYEPSATVRHAGGASTSRYAAAMQREFVVSKRRYLMRHGQPRAARRLLAVLRAAAAARLVRDVFRDRDAVTARWRLVTERELWRV